MKLDTQKKALLKLLSMAVFILPLVACLKINSHESLQLPVATQTGENTIGFEFDDTVFVPAQKMISAYNAYWLYPTYETSSGNFQIGVENRKHFDGIVPSLKIELDSVFDVGTHLELNQEETIFKVRNYSTKPTSVRRYALDTTFNNRVHFTRFDTVTPVFSGTFKFHMLEENTGHKIILNYGRFDFGTMMRLH